MRQRTCRGICSPTCHRENLPLTLFTERGDTESGVGVEETGSFFNNFCQPLNDRVANDPSVCTGDLQNGLRSPGTGNVMGFGVYGKSNRNKRETGRNGVKFEDNRARGMFIEYFMERATGRCVRNQIGFTVQTARPAGRYVQGGKIARCTTKSRGKRPCVSDFSGRAKFARCIRAVKNSTFARSSL